MSAIVKQEPRAVLFVVGNGTTALNPLIDQLKLRDNVILTGPVSPLPIDGEDCLADIYRSSQIYVSAGVASQAEGLSLAMLDGMSTGLAVVGTNISGNRDLIEHRISGLLVEPAETNQLAESILTILHGDELRSRLASSARSAVQEYHWEAIAKQYVEVHREEIETPPHSSTFHGRS